MLSTPHNLKLLPAQLPTPSIFCGFELLEFVVCGTLVGVVTSGLRAPHACHWNRSVFSETRHVPKARSWLRSGFMSA